jgi:hypothetical protein
VLIKLAFSKKLQNNFFNKMEKDDVLEIYIPIGTCDKTRLVVKDPITHSFKKGNTDVEWCTSEGRYIDDNGNECEAYFELPEQFSFGINGCYPMGTEKEDQDEDNISGLQVCYPITNMKTMENPTKSEQAAQYIFDCLAEVTWDKLVEQCDPEIDGDERKVPMPTYNSYLGATRGSSVNKSAAVKPPYAYPMAIVKGQKKKVEDRSKPQRAYIKLVTKGTGRSLRCITQIYGPGDKKVSPFKYIEVRGKLVPVMKWDGVFWGSHGQKSSCGASVRLRVSEMNFTPTTEGGPKRRMLGPNTAIPEEDDDSDDEEEDRKNLGNEKDEGFVNPMGDDDSMDILGKSSPVKDSKEEEIDEIEEEPKEEPKLEKKKKVVSSARRKELLDKKRSKATN